MRTWKNTQDYRWTPLSGLRGVKLNERNILYIRINRISGIQGVFCAVWENVMTSEEADAMQEWRGMDGATAFLLIERHADDWDDTREMMNAWLRANQGTNEIPS